jgi:ATP-binding cassette subfamily B protein
MKYPTIDYFYHFVKKQKWHFLLLIIIAAIYSLGQSILPYFIKHIVNQLYLLTYNSRNLLINNIILLISFWLISNIATIIQSKLLAKSFPLLRTNIYYQSIEHLQKLHHSKITHLSPGVLSRKITDLVSATEKIAHFLFLNVTHIIILMTLSVLLLSSVSSLCVVITLSWLILHFLNVLLYLRTGTKYTTRLAETSATFSGKLVDLFSNIRAMHLFSTHEYEKNYLSKYLLQEEQDHRNFLSHLEGMKIRQSLLSALFILLSVVFLIIGQLKNEITLGDFSMVLLLVFNLTSLVWSITFQLVNVIREFGVFTSSIQTIFDKSTLIKKHSIIIPKTTSDGLGISFKDVSFKYPDENYIFKNLNLLIHPGEKVAISGHSGSGKTTLINLLLRLYEPFEGSISINNNNIKNLSNETLQQFISYVPQENLFFNRSILENIRYGCLNATEQEIFEACELANCNEFISKLEKGYHTPIGEKGCYLSGGQLQRLAIARAVLKKSPILILDEPTSSLDEENSRLVEEIIPKVNKNSTLILITHRASTLRCANRVIELNKCR